MAASLAELVFPNGIPSLHCPTTGRLVLSDEEGFDPDTEHTPHLRFVIDWMGNAYAVDPETLPAEQAAYQRRIVALLGEEADQFENQNALVAACVAAMPASGLVFELLDPPVGSFDGSIAYFGFDLAAIDEDAGLESVRLEVV
jgi:hypothetical protein